MPKQVPPGVRQLVMARALEQSAEYASKNFDTALIFSRRQDLWEFCLAKLPKIQLDGGIIAEFGVQKGKSINFFARKCPRALVYGFDSFEGLEEDWQGFNQQKGAFSTKGRLPKCEKNVVLFKGWFTETVPTFLEQLARANINLLHMDADTYKPTAYVLNSLSENLVRGSIIIFDQFFGYPNFQQHEFKAWQEFSQKRKIDYIYIGYTEMQVAVQIL